MKTKIALSILAVLFTTAAMAKDSVQLKETISVGENVDIHFDIPVGSLEVTTHDGNEIVIDVKVKEADNDWFKSVDLDDAEIDIDQNKRRVRLNIDLKDTVQDWEVKIPEDASIDVNIGVGGVEIEDFSRGADIDVGVGEVDIELTSTDYREIELEAGVGGTDLRGFDDYHNERNMVNESIEWHGNGKYEINIDVGVGDIDVRN